MPTIFGEVAHGYRQCLEHLEGARDLTRFRLRPAGLAVREARPGEKF